MDLKNEFLESKGIIKLSLKEIEFKIAELMTEKLKLETYIKNINQSYYFSCMETFKNQIDECQNEFNELNETDDAIYIQFKPTFNKLKQKYVAITENFEDKFDDFDGDNHEYFYEFEKNYKILKDFIDQLKDSKLKKDSVKNYDSLSNLIVKHDEELQKVIRENKQVEMYKLNTEIEIDEKPKKYKINRIRCGSCQDDIAYYGADSDTYDPECKRCDDLRTFGNNNHLFDSSSSSESSSETDSD
jgi:hypothetical protein